MYYEKGRLKWVIDIAFMIENALVWVNQIHRWHPVFKRAEQTALLGVLTVNVMVTIAVSLAVPSLAADDYA